MKVDIHWNILVNMKKYKEKVELLLKYGEMKEEQIAESSYKDEQTQEFSYKDEETEEEQALELDVLADEIKIYFIKIVTA